jgi:hypothetical protein
MGSSLLSQFATAGGLMAAGIAVCGFVFHAGPALGNATEMELRRATAMGGLFGLLVTISVIVLSALTS